MSSDDFVTLNFNEVAALRRVLNQLFGPPYNMPRAVFSCLPHVDSSWKSDFSSVCEKVGVDEATCVCYDDNLIDVEEQRTPEPTCKGWRPDEAKALLEEKYAKEVMGFGADYPERSE